ncbi:mucoidy inhibitor MuiA family protein [Alistipes sp.]|uniref:mucoidy inhibitor MuiA family protein n=1 Tax=Alistipes sp. TaxID=1872444 RepID=UPI00307D7B26
MDMKRTLLLLLGLGAATLSAAGEQKVKTSVEQVTLFIDGAQVTRSRQIDLPAGNSTVVFTGLSPYLDDKSMQVSAKGPFTVTAVNRVFNHTDSLERSTRREALEQEIDKTQQQLNRLKASREVVDAESELLKTNCSVANRNVATPLAAIRELNEYYAARLEELKSKALSLDAEEEKINERRRQILAELVNLGGKQSVPMSEVEVRIEAPAACRGSFTLTYYVRNAGWFPSYDIRSGGLSEPVEISYKANIFQNTKEEWKNVALTLSSSNPTTGSIAPQLRTWWLDYGLAPPHYNLNLTSNTVSGIVFDEQREPLPGATVMVPGTTVGTSTDVQGRYSITVPNGATSLQFSYVGYTPRTERITGNSMNVTMQEDATALDEAVVVGYGVSNQLAGAAPGVRIRGTAASDRKVVEVDFADFDAESAVMEVEQTQNQLGYEFEIRQPYTIPSDGKSVAAEIGRFDLTAAYAYRSTPKIDKDAFLVAEATGWEKLNLLQGEANVYFENTFVGKSILDPGQTSDTLRFSMGRDRSIRIERTKENDYSSRRAIGSNQTQTVAWKFTVRNTRPEPVVLTLTDQLPVSRNSTIAVSAEELSGGRLDKESGIVAWRLELKPGEQRELHLRYAVKYPKGRSLAIE